MAEHEERERVVPHGHSGSGLAQWTLAMAPLLAAFAQQQLAYGLVVWACTKEMPVLVHIPALVALGVVALSSWVAWTRLRGVGARAPADERGSGARARFMYVLALVLCAFSALLVIAFWLPVVFVHPCRR